MWESSGRWLVAWPWGFYESVLIGSSTLWLPCFPVWFCEYQYVLFTNFPRCIAPFRSLVSTFRTHVASSMQVDPSASGSASTLPLGSRA